MGTNHNEETRSVRARDRGIARVAAALAGSGLVAGCSDRSGTSSIRELRRPGRRRGGSGRGCAVAPGAGQESAGTTGATGKSAAVAAPADLIIMAGLQLAVPDPTQAAARAEQDVLADGGYVAAEAEGVGPQTLPAANSTADGAESSVTGVSPMTLPPAAAAPNSAQALLLVRVPPRSVAKVLAQLSGTGSVSYRAQSETDVTGQVADVNSRSPRPRPRSPSCAG